MRAINRVLGLAASLVLAACGGGGGSGGDALTLTLTPATVSRTFFEDEPATFAVLGSVSGSVDGLVNVLIVDSVGVIQPNVSIQQIGEDYEATFSTATSLVAGSYSGEIVIRLCGSLPPTCSPAYASRSFAYNFTVQARPTPVIGSLQPASALAGGPDFTLTVNGSNFFPTSVVSWDGIAVPTTYVAGSELQASIRGASITNGGTPSVTVATGSRVSAAVPYTVLNPLPVLAAVSPRTTAAGCGPFTISVAGSGFVPGSAVQWQGGLLVTTFVSSTLLRAAVPAGLIATAGAFPLTVSSPAPGGGSSAARSATVAATLPAANAAVAYRVTPGHTGVANSTCPDSIGLTPLWDVDLGGEASYPLIVEGKVIVTIQRQGIPDFTTQVVALNQHTGAVAWGPFYVAGVDNRQSQANAAYDAGSVFIVGDYDLALPIDPANALASIQARSASTGSLRWRKPLFTSGSLSSSSTVATAAPTALNGLVYTNASVFGAGTGVRAFSQVDGNTAWSASSFNGRSPPTATASGVYLSEACSTLAYDPLTGVSQWSANSGGCGGGNSDFTTVTDGIVYSTAPGTPFYDAATGVQLGTLAQRVPSPIVAGTGYLAGFDFRITATTLATGAGLWTYPDGPTPFGSPDVAPILVDDRVIASDGDAVWALDAATGAVVWSVQTGGVIREDIGSVPNSGPLSGLGAGANLLVVPVGTRLRAYRTGSEP